MKKNILALTIALACASLTSCNLKSCFCCEVIDNDYVSSETYTSYDRDCESLNTKSYKCMEQGNQLPCQSIVYDVKK